MVLADIKGRSVQLEFPSPLSGPVTGLCSTYRRSRRRSFAFFDHAMAPISSWPSTMYGSIGLMRGDESRRSVPSKATRARNKPGRAWPCNLSRPRFHVPPSMPACQLYQPR
jgi:hypothetical protein